MNARVTFFPWLPLMVCLGCTTTVPAASSRYLAADSAAVPSAPLCFVPLNGGPSLAGRANADHLKELCEAAARKQGVSVVPFESPSCVVAATMDWASKPTGEIVEQCTGGLAIDCTGSMVHGKTLRVAMNRKNDAKQISETVSMIQSGFASINDHSVFALCSAAFFHYPMALKNEQFSVPVEN